MSLTDPSTKKQMAKWGGALVLLAGLLTPGRAHAQQHAGKTSQVTAEERAAESEKLAAQGFEAYKAGEYETAIEFYNQASEAHPAAALYFNVARIFETKLSAPEKALEYYRKALAAEDVTKALEEKSADRIRVITALLAQPTPSEEQAPPREQDEPEGGEPAPAERQTQATSPSEQETPRRSTQKTIGYAVGITGLVAAGAGMGLGLWALLERNEARKTCDGGNCSEQGGVDSMNTAHDLATASTFTVAVGGALVAVGLGLVLFAPQSNSADEDSATAVHPRPGRATGRSLQLAINPTSGGAAVHLSGAFF